MRELPQARMSAAISIGMVIIQTKTWRLTAKKRGVVATLYHGFFPTYLNTCGYPTRGFFSVLKYVSIDDSNYGR